MTPAQADAKAIHTSLLFDGAAERGAALDVRDPAYFADLNLDQIVDAVLVGREEYDLRPIFGQRPSDVESIILRHEVLQDLEDGPTNEHLTAFSRAMKEIRQLIKLRDASHYRFEREARHLRAIHLYCTAVRTLARGLSYVRLASRALQAIATYLADYSDSSAFIELLADASELKAELEAISFCLNLKGSKVTVRNSAGEPDLVEAVEGVFERFKVDTDADYRARFSDWPDMSHFEERIVARVARLSPEPFRRLTAFHQRYRSPFDTVILDFDRELQFFLSYLAYIQPLKELGLTFCRPRVSSETKNIFALDAFDLALAANLSGEQRVPVTNDFSMLEGERILIVSGPNQGGKTTFARMFGQLHHLASIGLPVPGSDAQLFHFDELFTHFGKEEDATFELGKLEDDVVRIHEVLNRATPSSIVILNELFASASLMDAVTLGTRVMNSLIELDLLCTYVTFVEKLASLGPSIVTMASTVLPADPTERTFKVVRKEPDGLAYAMAIAAKYGLTYEQLRTRIPR